MPAITSSIEYLADIDLYKTEKPWSGLLINSKERFFDKGQRLDNIEFEYHDHNIRDVREQPGLRFDVTGFDLCSQKCSTLSEFNTIEKLNSYKTEMSAFLKEKLGALYINTYDCHTRLNVQKTTDTVDVLDLLHVDSPARGAHNGEWSMCRI